jgi:ABC-type amino acid transport substrate-binding protein
VRAAASFGLIAGAAVAQPESAGPLVVAVPEAPPFAERGPDGVWDGLGVRLAEAVGQRLGRDVRFVAGGDSALARLGEADLALAPMTAAGEATADFAAPFYAARLGVARLPGDRMTDVLGRLFSMTFFWITAGLAVLLLIVGAMMWGIERRHDTDDIHGGFRGLWDGFWWAGVTMTTIGYGDTVPRSTAGRSLALLWMLVSMAVTASLTASIVSALGVGGRGSLDLPEDLQGDRVGVVEGALAATVLREANVDARPFPDVAAGLAAVRADSLDAFAGSAPRLRAARSSGSGLRVESTGVEFERWGLAVAPGSPLREPVARAVLDHVQSADWPGTVRRYVGPDRSSP